MLRLLRSAGVAGPLVLILGFCAASAAAPRGKLFVEKTAIRQRAGSYAEAWVDFGKELRRRGVKGTFDPNSIRVHQVADAGKVLEKPAAARFIPGLGFDPATKAVGRVVWRVAGDGIVTRYLAVDKDGYVINKRAKKRAHRFQTTYRIYFDIGRKTRARPALIEGGPEAGDIFPNGGFERSTKKAGVPDDYERFNPKIMSLDNQTVHSGKYALRITGVKGVRYLSLSVSDLRVESGRNYLFSFWARARGTDSNVACTASVLWFDRNRKVMRGEKNRPLKTGVMPCRYKRTDFDWERFEKTIQPPPGAVFGAFTVSTWSRVGHLWVDDIVVRPQALPDDPLEAERLKIATTTYQDLALLRDVSGEVVTPHVPWMKPSATGPIRTLYMAWVRKDTDGNLRHVVEFDQRMDMNYTFMPVLKRRLRGNPIYRLRFAADLEPYTIELLRRNLKDRYDLIVVDSLDFKGAQEQFTSPLLDAARKGAGVVLLGCRNLPQAFRDALAPRVPTPGQFALMPRLNVREPIAKALRRIYRLAKVGKGRVAAVSRKSVVYPCIPAGQGRYLFDPLAREFPGWEYRYIPWIRAMRWAAGREPALSVADVRFAKNTLVFALNGPAAAGSILEVTVRDEFGQAEKPVRAGVGRAADGVVAVSLPPLAGGTHVAEYRLLNAAAKVVDFGGYAFTVPAACDLKLTTGKPVYLKGEPVALRADLARVPDAAKLEVEVWDTYNRLLFRGARALNKGDSTVEIRANLPPALTVLHRAFATVVQGNRPLARKMVEFSRPDNFPKDDEYYVYLWSGGPLLVPGYFSVVKDAGFDSIGMAIGRIELMGAPMVHANVRPWGYWLMGNLGHKGDHNSRGDDRIRNPCFSDPIWWAERKARAGASAPKMLYYGIRDCILTDELHLGANVCFSKYTLDDFRKDLKTQYADLGALNAEWGTAFKTWAAAIPHTLKETQDKKLPLASWVDHKMFMTRVFARMIGHAADLYRPTIPAIKMGLSGTQTPGYTYNWWEFLKYAECVGNYGGIQNDLIRSFKRPGARIGRWTGGYAPTWRNAERYERNQPWAGLFNGSGSYFFFHGTSCWGMRGDLRINHNTRMALEEVNAIRGGIDKLLLTTPRRDDGIAIHYSQASLFAAMATIKKRPWEQALNAWKYMLDDMGLNFRFVSYEQLENGALDNGRFKVMILPVSLCLSSAEAQALARFVRSGGTVIADYGAGFYDGHGNPARNKALLDLFGVRRASTQLDFAAGTLRLSSAPAVGARARALTIRSAGEDLTLATGKALGECCGKPAVIVNRAGKGRAVLLNCVMHDYAKSDLTGGGETELIGRGDPKVTTPMRKMVADILAGAGIRPSVAITTDKGVNFQPLTRTVIYDAGRLRYVGILKSNSASKPILPQDYAPVQIDFGSVSHVYDVRAGKYLGRTRRVRAAIAPAIAKVYALLPYRVASVSVAARDIAAGEALVATVKVEGGGKATGDHAVTVRFIAPDGREALRYRAKAILKRGRGTVGIDTALNETRGRWTVRATDVASGVTGQTAATIR